MAEEQAQKTESFVDLLSYDNLKTNTESTRSSIIKSSLIRDAGVAKIEIIDGNRVEPSIFVHRKGDRIEKIEFVCTCGKSSHVAMEYDEE